MSKKVLLLFCALFVIASAASVSVYADDFTDTGGHWAQAPIAAWAGYDVLNGYSDGAFRPDGLITRGELFKVLDSVFRYQQEGQNRFSDLDESDWFCAHALRLAGAGVLNGSGGRVNANENITREQAFALLARVFEIAPNERGLASFSDAGKVSGWAKAEVGGLAAKGYVRGSGGALDPGGRLTRAEAVQVLDNIIKGFYSKAGTFSANFKGVALVNAPGVTLDKSRIDGDLYATQGLKSGDFTLSGSTLSGTMYVRGGGSRSIRIVGSTVGAISAKTDAANGAVRIVSSGGSTIGGVAVEDMSAGASLDGDFDYVAVGKGTAASLDAGEVGSVVARGASSTINIGGDSAVESIEVNAPNVRVNILGKVGLVTVAASGASINVGAGGAVDAIVVESGSAEIKGAGKVLQVTIESGASAKVETAGTKVTDKNKAGAATGTVTPGGTRPGGGGSPSAPTTRVAPVTSPAITGDTLTYRLPALTGIQAIQVNLTTSGGYLAFRQPTNVTTVNLIALRGIVPGETYSVRIISIASTGGRWANSLEVVAGSWRYMPRLATPAASMDATTANQIRIAMPSAVGVAEFEVRLTTSASGVAGLPVTAGVRCAGTVTAANVVALAKAGGYSAAPGTVVIVNIEVKAKPVAASYYKESEPFILRNVRLVM
ncbi:MAG: S-layer homology domain-containing protein [Clostridiales bacterium]|jgi:hypothetical protein|nr:S-layer homology domain-containing protein [Clostridiales bacterium]